MCLFDSSPLTVTAGRLWTEEGPPLSDGPFPPLNAAQSDLEAQGKRHNLGQTCAFNQGESATSFTEVIGIVDGVLASFVSQ